MEHINSLVNPKIKLAVSLQQKKYRDKYNLFLLEGLRNAETAVNAGAKIDMCFCTPEIIQNKRAQKLLANITCSVYEIPENIFSRISDTKSPQGLMLVVHKNERSLDEWTITPGGCLLILDRLQDPGNIGTLIRTADALGAAGIICLNGTADVFSPKVVRSAMGSLFSLPFAVKVTEDDLQVFCRKYDLKLYAAALDRQAQIVWNTDFSRSCGIILGNEANGVSERLLNFSAAKIYIPMLGSAESLNVATAGAMIMYERHRQCFEITSL